MTFSPEMHGSDFFCDFGMMASELQYGWYQFSFHRFGLRIYCAFAAVLISSPNSNGRKIYKGVLNGIHTFGVPGYIPEWYPNCSYPSGTYPNSTYPTGTGLPTRLVSGCLPVVLGHLSR